MYLEAQRECIIFCDLFSHQTCNDTIHFQYDMAHIGISWEAKQKAGNFPPACLLK